MIQVHYTGTLGNNMFQYAYARVLAEHTNMRLVAPYILGFPRTYDEVGRTSLPVTTKISRAEPIDTVNTAGGIKMHGGFINYPVLKPHKEQIRQWFELDVEPPIVPEKDDLVLSIRRTWNGYPEALCLPFSFFDNLLQNVVFYNLYIASDSLSDPFFDQFKKYDPILLDKYSGIEQFAIIRAANKMVLTPSTFCFWAAWLSDAEEIYFPKVFDFDDQDPVATDTNMVMDDHNIILVDINGNRI